MKKLDNKGVAHLLLVAFVVLIFAVGGAFFYVQSQAEKTKPASTTSTAPAASTADSTRGNGAPSGAHYNLNIIGVPKGKTADITTGHRIFVPLEGVCKIDLKPGDFNVLDGNCSDGSRAAFQLPVPDADADGVMEYSVWARPLGKPGGKATATTCALSIDDPATTDVDESGEEVCSIESTAFVREKGKSSFSNVSKGFLTVLVDLDGDPATAPERLSIFDDRLQDYFWNYDNKGLKLLQLRFYQES